MANHSKNIVREKSWHGMTLTPVYTSLPHCQHQDMTRAWIQMRFLCHSNVTDTQISNYFTPKLTLWELILLQQILSWECLSVEKRAPIFLFVWVGVAVRAWVHLSYLPKADSNYTLPNGTREKLVNVVSSFLFSDSAIIHFMLSPWMASTLNYQALLWCHGIHV